MGILRPGSQKRGSELIGRKPASEHREAGRVCCGVTIDSVMGFPGVTCTLLGSRGELPVSSCFGCRSPCEKILFIPTAQQISMIRASREELTILDSSATNVQDCTGKFALQHSSDFGPCMVPRQARWKGNSKDR